MNKINLALTNSRVWRIKKWAVKQKWRIRVKLEQFKEDAQGEVNEHNNA